jgi:hypothetical protein
MPAREIPLPLNTREVPASARLIRDEGAESVDVYSWGDDDAPHMALVYSEDVNYRAASGDWQDLRLSRTDAGWEGLTGDGGAVTVSFPGALGPADGVGYSIDGGSLEITPVGVEGVKGSVDGLSVLYEEALPATDLIYTLDGHGYKETVVWRDPSAASVLAWTIRATGITLAEGPDGTIQLFGATGRLGSLSEPIAVEAKGLATTGTYSLKDNGDATVQLELSLDESFLETATYPVSIDPGIHDNGDDLEEAFRDTYVDGSNPSTAFESATTLKAGNTPSRHTYVRFAIGAFQRDQRLVYDARMSLARSSGTGGNVEAHRVIDPWPAQMTWNNRPAAGALIDPAHGFDGTWATWQLKEQYQHILQTGYAGHWTNEGTRLSKPAGSSEWVFHSLEAAPGTSADPFLFLGWNDLPAAPTLDLPDQGVTVQTTSPTLRVNAVPNDVNNDGVYTRFQVSDDGVNWSGGHLVHQSGWLLKQKSYVVPSGLLVDGAQYRWRVQSWDGYPLTDGAGVQRVPNTSGVRNFWVS